LISANTQHCIEQLCADGCQAVYHYIQKLEQGEHVPYIDNLNETEKQQVLAELKSIMGVYNKNSGSCQ